MAHLLHPPRPPPVDRGLARGGLGLGLGGEGGGVGGVRAVRADQNQQDEGAKQCWNVSNTISTYLDWISTISTLSSPNCSKEFVVSSETVSLHNARDDNIQVVSVCGELLVPLTSS